MVQAWAIRRVLSWRVSITLDTTFCLAAVEEAIARYGPPATLNTDQGSHFTGAAFTRCLLQHGIQISMDGLGCWRDNVFVERLWRSLKYEEVYLHAHDSVTHATTRIGRYLTFHNSRRPHSHLNDHTPPTKPTAPPSHCLALPNHSPVASRYLPRLRLYRKTGPLLPRDRSMATAWRRESRSPSGR